MTGKIWRDLPMRLVFGTASTNGFLACRILRDLKTACLPALSFMRRDGNQETLIINLRNEALWQTCLNSVVVTGHESYICWMKTNKVKFALLDFIPESDSNAHCFGLDIDIPHKR